MKKTILCMVAAVLMLAATIPAFAQDNRADVFLGASFTHNGTLPHSFKGSTESGQVPAWYSGSKQGRPWQQGRREGR